MQSDIVYKKADGNEVNRNDWHWEFEAEHTDGSTHPQFNEETGLALGFFDIDQTQLKQFSMKRGVHRFDLEFPQGAKLIHKRRTTSLNNDSVIVITYLFGYELGKKVVLHQLIQHIGDTWLLVSTESKDSVRWVT